MNKSHTYCVEAKKLDIKDSMNPVIQSSRRNICLWQPVIRKTGVRLEAITGQWWEEPLCRSQSQWWVYEVQMSKNLSDCELKKSVYIYIYALYINRDT